MSILKKPAVSPKTLTLIAVDLVKSLADGNAAPFKLNMNQR